MLWRSLGAIDLAMLPAAVLLDLPLSCRPRAVPNNRCCGLVIVWPLTVPRGLPGIGEIWAQLQKIAISHAQNIGRLRPVTGIDSALYIRNKDGILASR
jgi:hypothetical protein